MAIQNQIFNTTVTATESLSAANQQYVAVGLDGAVANTAEQAIGILQNKPRNNEEATLTYMGETFFRAGDTVALDAAVTVTTSGYMITATSGDGVVGKCKIAATSGSVGTLIAGGFANAQNQADYFTYGVTAADAIGASFAYALNDNKLANADNECSGLAVSAIASGASGRIVVQGITTAIYANSYGPDQDLMATTSGYLTAVTSGYVPNARALTGATSGVAGTVLFWGGGGAVLS
jgi:hypothetical protein